MSNFPVFFAVLYYICVTNTWMQVSSDNYKSCSVFFSRANFYFRFDITFDAALLNKLLNIKDHSLVIKMWKVFSSVGVCSCSKDVADPCIFSLTFSVEGCRGCKQFMQGVWNNIISPNPHPKKL